MKSEDALKRFASSRQALFDAIAGLSEAELTEPEVEGIWTIKDLLGHITSWERTLIEPVASFAMGGTFKKEVITDIDAWNLSQSSLWCLGTCSDIRKELESVRHDLLTQLNKLSNQQWEQVFYAPWGDKNTIIEMISGLAWHEEEHTRSILNYRSR